MPKTLFLLVAGAAPAVALGCGGASGTDFGNGDSSAGDSSNGGGTAGSSQGGSSQGGSSQGGSSQGGSSQGGSSQGGSSQGGSSQGGSSQGGSSQGGSSQGGSNPGGAGSSQGGGMTGGAAGTAPEGGTGATGGGGSSGASGRGGGGGEGGGTNCASIVATARAALLAAQVCDPRAPATKCTGTVKDLCDCTVPVNDPESEATKNYLAVRDAAVNCGVPCLAIVCPEPTNATCGLARPAGPMDIVIGPTYCSWLPR